MQNIRILINTQSIQLKRRFLPYRKVIDPIVSALLINRVFPGFIPHLGDIPVQALGEDSIYDVPMEYLVQCRPGEIKSDAGV